MSLKAVTTWQPWGAEENSHSPKDLLLKVAGVRAVASVRTGLFQSLLSTASEELSSFWNRWSMFCFGG